MKNFCKILTVLILATLFSNALVKGQVSKEAGDRIKSKRIAFFTEKLQLTPEEAQKFWPVFNEYDAKKSALSLEKRKLTDNFQNNSSKMSEKDVDETIIKFIQFSKQETALVELYNKRFRLIISAQKVMKLYLAETEFKIVLLKELKSNSKSGIAN
jgi:hypothetical protein